MCVYRSLFAIDSVKEHQVGFNLQLQKDPSVNLAALMSEYLDKAGDAFCNNLNSDFDTLSDQIGKLVELDHSKATWEQKSKELCAAML